MPRSFQLNNFHCCPLARGFFLDMSYLGRNSWFKYCKITTYYDDCLHFKLKQCGNYVCKHDTTGQRCQLVAIKNCKINKMIIASMCGLDAAHSLQMRYIVSQGKLNTFVMMCRTHHSSLVICSIFTHYSLLTALCSCQFTNSITCIGETNLVFCY